MRFGTYMLSVLSLTLLAACSSGENARPDPVDLTQFTEHSTKFDVIGTVGQPQGTTIQNGRPYDIYQLYTGGMGSGAKAAMALGEGLTDVATLGLAEVGWSAVHAGTRPRIHTVLFGYDVDDKVLVDIYDKDPSRASVATHIVLNKEIYSKPIILKAPPEKPLPEAGNVKINDVSATVPNGLSNSDESADQLNNVEEKQVKKENKLGNPL